MTLTLSLWILERLLTLSFAASSAPVCQIPVSEWMNEPAVGAGFAEKQTLPLEAPMEKELRAFFSHFDSLYGQRSESAVKAAQGATKAWVEKLPLAYEKETLVPLAKAIRRWAGLYLRDTVPGFDASSRRTALEKFRFLDKLFSTQPPPFTDSLCLDEELATDAQDAKKVRAQLLALKAQRDDLNEFSEELEKQYLQRIRENPASADRILPYAHFLFALGRLEEAGEQLKQAKALNPKLAGMEALSQAIQKAGTIENPTDRWSFIRAFTNERRIAEEASYRASQKPHSAKSPPKRK